MARTRRTGPAADVRRPATNDGADEAPDPPASAGPRAASDGAASAENGGETAASSRSTRTKAITGAQKDALQKLFSAKFDGWKSTSLPREGVDLELDDLLKEHGLARTQASRQLLNFKKASRPGDVAVRVEAPAEEIEKKLENRLGGVDTVVDDVLESFPGQAFCVDDVFRGNYFAECREAVRPHVEGLVEAFLKAAAKSSARSVTAAEKMLTKFAEGRFDVQDDRRAKFLDDANLCKMVREKTPPMDSESEPALFFTFLEMHTFDTFTEMLADHARPELRPPDELPEPDVTDRRAGLLYYLAGWLVFKVKRVLETPGRRDDLTVAFWTKWFEHNTVDEDDATRLQMPKELTDQRVRDRMKQYRGRKQLIEYASPDVFAFVWGVEVTYAKLLTTANLLAFSGDLVVKIHKALMSHGPTLKLFRATIPNEALVDRGESPALIQALAGHLLTCYHKMRGRDFVKQVMSNLKSVSAEQNRNSHRDQLAAVSTAASNAARARSENNKNRSNEETTSVAVDDAPSFFRAEEQGEDEEEESSDLLPSP